LPCCCGAANTHQARREGTVSRFLPPFAQASPVRAGKNEIRTVKRARPTARGAEIIAKSLPISRPVGNSQERQIDVINDAFAGPVFTPTLSNRANRSARRMSGFQASSGHYGRYANDKDAPILLKNVFGPNFAQ
jgi:hypothetical protein